MRKGGVAMSQTCASCGDEFEPPGPEDMLVASGGFCMPTEIAAALPDPLPECSDCRSRMLMAMMIGIDPGRKGENLRVSRAGVKYRGDSSE